MIYSLPPSPAKILPLQLGLPRQYFLDFSTPSFGKFQKSPTPSKSWGVRTMIFWLPATPYALPLFLKINSKVFFSFRTYLLLSISVQQFPHQVLLVHTFLKKQLFCVIYIENNFFKFRILLEKHIKLEKQGIYMSIYFSLYHHQLVYSSIINAQFG